MSTTIRHRWTNAVLREVPGANLWDANLTGANLRGADLRGADLRGAALRGANLTDADLTGANLMDADLRDADLTGANLMGADLHGATMLREDLTWAEYLAEVVPALLTAGGRPLAEVATPEHWACHSWSNCPMAAAFGARSLDEVPALYRGEAGFFLTLFDAGAIPLPATAGAE